MGQYPAYEVVSSRARVARLCSLESSTNSVHSHRALPTEMGSEEEVKASSSLHLDSRAEDVHSEYRLHQDFSRLQSAPSAQHFGSNFHRIHSIVPPSEVAWRTSPRIVHASLTCVVSLCIRGLHRLWVQHRYCSKAWPLQHCCNSEAWPVSVSPRASMRRGDRPLRAPHKIGTLLCDI